MSQFQSPFIYRPLTNQHALAKIDYDELRQTYTLSIAARRRNEGTDLLTDLESFLEFASDRLGNNVQTVSLIIPQYKSHVLKHLLPHDTEQLECLHKCAELSFWAPRNYLIEIINSLNQCGLQVNSFYEDHQVLASAINSSCIQDTPKVFVDLDARVTCVSVFKEDNWQQSAKIPLGYEHFLQDLKSGLAINDSEANEVCFLHGFTDRTTGLGMDIMISRARELASAIGHQLLPFKGQLNQGIHLLGSGASIPGIGERFAAILKISVQPAALLLVDHSVNLELNVHAENLQLIDHSHHFTQLKSWAIHMIRQQRVFEQNSSVWGQLKQWIKELS